MKEGSDLDMTFFELVAAYTRDMQPKLKHNTVLQGRILQINGELNRYLHNVDEECYQRMELLIRQLKEKQGVTEQLKAKNQMYG